MDIPIKDKTFTPKSESKFDAEKRLEEVNEKYKEVMKMREGVYKEDIKNAEPDEKLGREVMYGGMEMHNNIVMKGGLEIIDKMSDLEDEDRVAAIIAIGLHDVGKVATGFNIKEHHTAGVERAEKIMKDLVGKSFDGVKITEDIAKKVVDAVERHMNHPFLINVMNKGERFPEPETVVDKIIFDSDMIANLTFKNFGFRLNNDMIDIDLKELEGNDSIKSYTGAVLDNILFAANGAKDTEKVVLTDEGKEVAKRVMENVSKIHDKLVEKAEEIEAELARDAELEEFDIKEVLEKIGNDAVKAKYNEHIKKAGEELNIKTGDLLM